MDLNITSSKRKDLHPRKRLDGIFERNKSTHVDPIVDIEHYVHIANALLTNAKRFQKDEKFEESLNLYIKYCTLAKKIKTHPRYNSISLATRSTIDYRIKSVSKEIKDLSDKLYELFKKTYKNTNLGICSETNLERFQEQRATVSTVRTFVSASFEKEQMKELEPEQIVSSKSRRKSSTLSPLMRSLSAHIDNQEQLFGMKRMIFPAKQVREFDQIYSQRRMMRSHRSIVVPSKITIHFSHLSLQNNRKNIETVGYLAGKVASMNALQITHLILPDQVGYPDYFKVRDTKNLLVYLEENNLMIFGWIHSHPIEREYLSSSDMHYHTVFQSVLPEAIAIVYSPVTMKSTIFNLTPNHGLKLIMECSKKGFHTHPSNPSPQMISQHAIIDYESDLTVKDFRNQSNKTVEIGDGPVEATNKIFERMLRYRRSVVPKVRKSEITFVHIN